MKYAGYYTVGEAKSTYLAHNTAYAFYGGRQVFKYRKMLDCAELSKGGASNLDLQIVLSASAGLRKNFAVVRNGGCLYHCDSAATSADGKGRAWQSVGGALVDLRAGGGAPPAPSERMDPLTRPELADLAKKTGKLDAAFEKAQIKEASQTLDKAAAKSFAQAQTSRYVQARGGTVHFFDATIP